MNEISLKNFFAKKETQDIRTTDSDDYTIAKNHRTDIILRIVSFLFAVAIWVAILIGDSATKEFTNFSMTEIGGTNLRNAYMIEYDSTLVNFVLQGKGSQISQIQDSDIRVYVDFSSVLPSLYSSSETKQTFDLPLIYEIDSSKGKNSNIVFVQKSKESIKVTFTKK